MKQILFQIFITSVLILFNTSCTKFKYVDDNNFIGIWKVNGRSIYKGMTFQITQENNKLIGHIISPPTNKYSLFIDSSDIWISKIHRISNYSFKITEEKIAKELFSEYGLNTTNVFYATFTNKDTINLTEDTPHTIKKSNIYYSRINK